MDSEIMTSFSFMTALKSCAKKKDLYQILRIHAEICNSGLLNEVTYLGNTLVSAYAKCGALTKARKVLDELPAQNVVSWNALIAGYAQHGCGKEALDCFHQMQSEKGLSPDAITYACTLKACGIVQDIAMGERIHEEVVSRGLLEKDVVLGGALVDMYAKCGALSKARKVQDELPAPNVVSWGALIAGYAQHGCGMEALDCFHQMRSEKGLSPDAITYACTLKACGIVQNIAVGEKIHNEVASQGLLEKDVVLGGALVDMYAKCGALSKARRVLDELPARDVISWSALIAGYAQHGCGKEALDCFHEMRSEKGLSPNEITYVCTLKACGIVQNIAVGEKIHDEVASQGLLEKHVALGGALVDMYAKCGALRKARKVLDALPARNVVSWSALIAGYAQHGCGKEALDCFHQMRSEKGVSPNEITYACTLKACGIVQNIAVGEKIHDEVASLGLLEKHVVLGGALVDMYAKCGALSKARKVLDELPAQDVVCWNALISGYAQHGCGKEALDCFHQMRSEKGLSPDAITYACILRACGIVQDIAMGEKIHDEVASQGLYVVLGGDLVDMYAKCGALSKARKVLDELPARNVVSWNALIAGYAQHCCGKEALDCFHQMRSEKGLSPDAITYACTLKACGIVQDIAMGERIHDEVASQGLLEKHVMLGGALVDMYAKCGALTKARKVLD